MSGRCRISIYNDSSFNICNKFFSTEVADYQKEFAPSLCQERRLMVIMANPDNQQILDLRFHVSSVPNARR